tara:strand:- start:1263 stop:1523 length:261 start_codon:yes stop_codon:yes gene_type:complete
MDINQLIDIVKKKIKSNLYVEELKVIDKTFLHKKHISHEKEKFHIQIIIKSEKLKLQNKIETSRVVHKILKEEIREFIHSLQIKLI